MYRTDNEHEYSIGVRPDAVGDMGVALEYHKDKESGFDIWGLVFNVVSRKKFSFDEGSFLLIRTNSDTIIELRETVACYKIKTDSHASSHIYTLFMAQPRYSIDEKQLNIIISEGVKKLRFDSTTGYIDYVYEKDEIGSLLNKQKGIILKEMSFNRDF